MPKLLGYYLGGSFRFASNNTLLYRTVIRCQIGEERTASHARSPRKKRRRAGPTIKTSRAHRDLPVAVGNRSQRSEHRRCFPAFRSGEDHHIPTLAIPFGAGARCLLQAETKVRGAGYRESERRLDGPRHEPREPTAIRPLGNRSAIDHRCRRARSRVGRPAFPASRGNDDRLSVSGRACPAKGRTITQPAPYRDRRSDPRTALLPAVVLSGTARRGIRQTARRECSQWGEGETLNLHPS